MLKVYYDAEFTGLHRYTTLISIGMVSELGNYFYAEFTNYNRNDINEWLQDNVINHLLYDSIDEFVTKSIHAAPRRLQHSRPGHVEIVKDCKVNNVIIKGSNEFIKNELLKWLKDLHESSGNDKIQFYTDCYAYDWVLLNDLICEDGMALNLPDFIYYIPMDLSTVLQFHTIDPDINREAFIGDSAVSQLKNTVPFSNWGDSLKHNCLWDASVCKICFDNITSTV